MKLSQADKNYLLALSRKTLTDFFKDQENPIIDEKSLPDKSLKKYEATFVTITKKGKLCGCIGNILPKEKIYQSIINNTISAAFFDPRFPQLKADELEDINIEISILSKPEPILYKNEKDLIKKIVPIKHGVVLQSKSNQATFLPQVWDDLPKTKDFLSALSKKAGLSPNGWKDSRTELFSYTCNVFKEN